MHVWALNAHTDTRIRIMNRTPNVSERKVEHDFFSLLLLGPSARDLDGLHTAFGLSMFALCMHKLISIAIWVMLFTLVYFSMKAQIWSLWIILLCRVFGWSNAKSIACVCAVMWVILWWIKWVSICWNSRIWCLFIIFFWILPTNKKQVYFWIINSITM